MGGKDGKEVPWEGQEEERRVRPKKRWKSELGKRMKKSVRQGKKIGGEDYSKICINEGSRTGGKKL